MCDFGWEILHRNNGQEFYILLTVHVGIIFVNNQLDAQFFLCFRLVCKPSHQTVIYTKWHIPDVVLIKLILLMMGTWLPETCTE